METLKEKFTTVCQGCDGTLMIEEPLMIMGEIVYKDLVCGCEDGKELDWQKIDSEIKNTKDAIKHYNESTNIVLQLAREYHDKQDTSLVFDAIGKMKYYETKVSELEDYLAELETIE